MPAVSSAQQPEEEGALFSPQRGQARSTAADLPIIYKSSPPLPLLFLPNLPTSPPPAQQKPLLFYPKHPQIIPTTPPSSFHFFFSPPSFPSFFSFLPPLSFFPLSPPPFLVPAGAPSASFLPLPLFSPRSRPPLPPGPPLGSNQILYCISAFDCKINLSEPDHSAGSDGCFIEE